ncbi:hypothetical protein [Streptomyces sp. NBC_01565]|uniref:hypothetical protein n=1 Tax=unclassified Streptomyces TaxID=2593676 RepID=UPI00224DDB22|nr:hypothetical protein [Streptomyces sp. NBC_01565]MCX4539406.1 hypothetical protein [Streptomyces sp. NBC_01565]
MSIGKKTATTVGALALAFAGVLGTAGQSFAGGNGQQIVFADVRGNTYSVYLVGTNQNGERSDICFNTPGPTTYVGGWWWKGTVSYLGFAGAGCTGATRGSFQATVPTYQTDTDWYTITN